ncbi:hypothetical protein BH11BAC3_BH11BAC3_20410 [soil metagenome]
MKIMLKNLGRSSLLSGMVSMIMMLGNSCDQNNPVADKLPQSKRVSKTIADTVFAGDRDTMILVTDGEAFLRGHIKDSANKIKYTMPVWSNQHVVAVITSLDTSAHIRFVQVKLPGEKIKSSFGNNVDIHINANGNFNFIVGRDLVADENNTGDFILHIIVK